MFNNHVWSCGPPQESILETMILVPSLNKLIQNDDQFCMLRREVEAV